MVDAFVTQKIIIKFFAYCLQIGHRNKYIFNYGVKTRLCSHDTVVEGPLDTEVIIYPWNVDELVRVHSFFFKNQRNT